MDLEEIKRWRSTEYLVRSRRVRFDWLIAEVERLNNIIATDDKDWTVMEETLTVSCAECEKYKAALEEIDGLYPATNPPGVLLARGIARTALQK